MTDRLGDLRRHLPIPTQAIESTEGASMRWLELSLAIAAIAVVVLLALAR